MRHHKTHNGTERLRAALLRGFVSSSALALLVFGCGANRAQTKVIVPDDIPTIQFDRDEWDRRYNPTWNPQIPKARPPHVPTPGQLHEVMTPSEFEAYGYGEIVEV